MEKHLMKRLAWIFLSSAILLTVFLVAQLPNLKLDYDFEKFFPENAPETEYFAKHRKLFESDNDFILLAIESENGVFQTDFLNRVSALTDSLDSLDLVQNALSLTNTKELLIAGGISFSKAYYSGQDSLLSNDSIRIYSHPELVQSFIDKDANSVCIFIRHQDYISKKKCDLLVNQIESLCDKFQFDKRYLSGRAPGQAYYIDKMQFEMLFFIGLSMVLIVIFLIITFQSFWGVWIPMLIVLGSMIWIMGCISLFGSSINLTMTVLPSIMFVVGTSDVIHLMSKYLEFLRSGKSKNEAIYLSYKEVGLATFLTSLTTSIGFLSLLVVNIEPIQTFGLYSALGVLLAFLLSYTLLPALLYFTNPPKRLLKNKQQDTFWSKQLNRWFPKVVKQPKKIVFISIAILALAGIGIGQLEANNFLLDDLDESASVKRDFNFLDANYGGVRPFELGIQTKDSLKYPIDSREILNEIQKIETYLEDEFGLQNIISINQSLILANRTYTNKQITSTTELSDKKHKKYLRTIKKQGREFYNLYVNGSHTRVSGQIEDLGNKEISQRTEKFKQFLNESVDLDKIEVNVTGTAFLIDLNMSYLSRNLMNGLLIALVVVSILMGILYKSFKMVVVALIPNVIPLLLVAGWMGFFGIDLKFSTAVIFTIAFGIAVDDTIHFMSKYRLELQKGRSEIYALKRTFLSTGRAIILTSLILIAGFLLLIFSDFKGTYYIGVMISLSLIFAVVADLTLLPVLLNFIAKGRGRK